MAGLEKETTFENILQGVLKKGFAKENTELDECIKDLQKNCENAYLKDKHSHDCPNCVAFARHCPHKVNGDPYYYDCYLTIADLEKENAELKEKLGDVQMQKAGEKSDLVWKLKTANEQKAEQLTKAKELIKRLIKETYGEGWNYSLDVKVKAEQFLKECE